MELKSSFPQKPVSPIPPFILSSSLRALALLVYHSGFIAGRRIYSYCYWRLKQATVSSEFEQSLVMVVAIPFSWGYTCEEDVYAISSLHTALGYPLLPGWTPFGGDPCLQGWQGVQCVGPNITAIVINDANLGGELGDKLGNFTSIITLDLSNNHIGGTIPKNLPLTLRQLFLSSNQLTGRIPRSLENLTLLSDVSFNENLLNGELPDSFQSLAGLVNLDVSSNNLSGPLPPSFTSLSSLTTLHIQDNHISGILDVLQDLPLIDLDIENNLFSGPVPEKLWNIPNFKSNGNPFNTTVAPSAAPTQALSSLVAPVPSPFPFDAPTRHRTPTRHSGTSSTVRKKSTMISIAYAAVAVMVIIAVLLALFCALKLRERRLKCECFPKSHKKGAPKITMAHLGTTDLPSTNCNKEECLRPIMAEKGFPKHIASLEKSESYLCFEKGRPQKGNCTPPASITSFSIASLQQYTNYFGEERLIKSTFLGSVYMAELSDGKLLTVLKFNNPALNVIADDFHDLVSRISKLQHPNIIELVGYCSQFGQRLLIFKYFSRTTLHDLLYDFYKKRISWNSRIQIALEAAKTVEYLHEFCKPPLILRSLEPSSILLDEDLAVCISEYSLASFVLSNSLNPFSGDLRAPTGYDAPEISESRSYTDRSDVYSFGVVMLELLTGRQPYESSYSRAEQHLVRWASPHLYDINALSRIVDPSIDGVVSLKSLSRFADIIGRCIQQAPEFRPSMSQIVQDLILVLKDATIC
ncbi:protein STRUBBELIG-RECEPTOR FAMILY 3-like isoform X2 [Phalaenopsis equestris]|uniref:protein STRUBBELIG-RECEPTOR FAMILY 3-like isoform X2 n=1 Tax=Phalaenopsis equestris TaxID=78828 RepID=UPI0009E2AA8F|nr:protein STRUBBELIG-RECEPTOR FAMILY 3-like isoform X2 [Phalaenopsis equestris]